LLELYVPQESVGPVLAHLTAKRGRITGLEIKGLTAVIHADCPVRESRSLAPSLSALTGGRGWFVTGASHYETLPQALVAEVIAASPCRPKPVRVRANPQGLQQPSPDRLQHLDPLKAGQA
jgi:elongation factor G